MKIHKQRGFIGDLIGGIFGYKGTSQQGEDMIHNTQMANDFSAHQADINREFTHQHILQNQQFQERMSGTSYQRAVGDMESAGLNPMLAYSQGGASSPAGGSGPSGNAPQGQAAGTVNKLGAIAPAAQAIAQIAQTKATTENINADTANKRSEQIGPRSETGEILNLPTSWKARLERGMGEEAWNRAQKAIADTELSVQQREQVMQQIKNAITENKLRELDIPRAIAEARAHDPNSTFGKYHPYFDATIKGIGTAAQLRGRSGGKGITINNRR